MTTDLLITSLALIGVVILIAALMSGLIERSGIPQVALFLALGAALGPSGLNLVNVTIDSPVLRTVATLSLALVLFIDAVTLNLPEVRRHAGLTARMILPGTLLSAAVVAFAAWALLGVSVPAAIMLGAAMSSIDPVLLRGLLKWDAMPPTARLGLRLESGLNDIALLPLLLVALNVELLGDLAQVQWGQLLLDLFVLGPGAGVAVGVVAVSALELVRSRIGVRRDYESIYSLGIAFTAFAAAEAVGGSGFLAAFAAGLTISALDVELCDCFVEYGETTAEMALLLTFVLFGASIIWTGFSVITVATLAFAAIALLSRVPVYWLALWRASLDRRSRWYILWFGPRGLSTLLLILLPVFAGAPGAASLFAICALVVLISIVLHGGATLVATRLRPATVGGAPLAVLPIVAPSSSAAAPRTVAPTAPPVNAQIAPTPADGLLITVEETIALWDSGAPVVVGDARATDSYLASDRQARGAVRLNPDMPVFSAKQANLPKDAWIVLYCT